LIKPSQKSVLNKGIVVFLPQLICHDWPKINVPETVIFARDSALGELLINKIVSTLKVIQAFAFGGSKRANAVSIDG
jgi:hypothetical protein